MRRVCGAVHTGYQAPKRYLWRSFRRDDVMNEVSSGQNDDDILQLEFSDVILEASAGDVRDNANAFTQWVCTALYFCPGP
jgi:hypothetical protein